jgi:CRP-like cAMP-binding protein
MSGRIVIGQHPYSLERRNMSNLSIVEKVIALEDVEVFSDLTPDQLARVAAIAREVRLAPGEFILDGTKRIEALYVIVDGAVDVSLRDEKLLSLRPGQVLGMWAIFQDPDPTWITARAVEDTWVLRIDREDFYELLADHSEITSVIFSTLIKRFRSGQQAVTSGGGK